jgi:hypothetical protein
MDFSKLKHVGELKKASITFLKDECQRLGIGEKHISKTRAIILLCEAYGIPTTGEFDPCVSRPRFVDGLSDDEVDYYSTLTVSYLEKLPGWTKDIRQIPDIDIGHVKQYLLLNETVDPESYKPLYTKEILRSYKTSRPWRHMEAGHLHSIAFNPLDCNKTFCVVRASCLPSQSTLPDDVKWLHVVLNKENGQPHGGYCSCTVG